MLTPNRCQAGREADFGGRWLTPCQDIGNNVLHFSTDIGGPVIPQAPVLRFCDRHMAELINAGLIEEVAVPIEEARRRGYRGP